MKDKVTHWQTLYDVARTLGSALNLPAIFNQIAEKAVNAMNVKACSIRLLDRRGERLELAAAYGLSEEYTRKGPVEIGESPVDRETLAGKPVAVFDVTTDDRWQYQEEAEHEGIRSVLSVPLAVRDKVIGTIRVYTSMKRPFEEEEVHFLSALAGLGTIAIENARLNQRLRKRCEDMSILFEISRRITSTLKPQEVFNLIVRSATEAMSMRGCLIRLLNEKRERLELVAAYGLSEAYLKKGPVEVAKGAKDVVEGRPISIYDASTDPRVQYPEEAEREGIKSILGVPLAVRDRVIGAIRVYSSTAHEFDEDEINFLLALASQAAIAIENARLYRIALDNWQDLVSEIWERSDVWGTSQR